jgi:hypothetical protein
VIPDASDHEARLRSVDFTVIGLVEASALELAPTVGFVNHGHQRFSVRVRYVPATADYRTSWRMVDSRPRQPDDDERSIDQRARSALRQALKYEDVTPRLLGETATYSPDKARRTQARTAPVEHISVTIDGEPAEARLVQHGDSFGCRILLPATVVTTFGRDAAARLEFRRIDRHELLGIPPFWEHAVGF